MGVFSIIGGLFHIGALALLLLATLTSPITQSLYLAEDGDYKFGVFGYCNVDKDSCSSVMAANYSFDDFSDLSSDYILDTSKRDSLVKILLVIPIACGFTFFSFIFTLINTRTNSQSPLVLFIVSIVLASLAIIASMLACIFAILVFYPHVKWPAWLQIGSVILNIIALVFIIINLKMCSASDDLTSMDNGIGLGSSTDEDDDEKNSYFRNNLDSSAAAISQPPVATSAFTMPPRTQFGTVGTVAGVGAVGGAGTGSTTGSRVGANMSTDDSSSFTERKSINDITLQQNRYPSSNSQGSNNSQQPRPNLYAGPMGSSTRNPAPIMNQQPQVADPLREPTIPQIANPYVSSKSTSANNLSIGDDRNIFNAGGQGYNDPALDDNNSLEADSDFTSVSQRAVNPKYYHGANNLPPAQQLQQQQRQQIPPQQGSQPGPMGPMGPGPQQQQPRFYPPPQQPQQQFGPPPQQYMMQQNPYANTQFQQQQPQQPLISPQSGQFRPAARHVRRHSKPNTSDILLQNNPDFMLGQGITRKQQIQPPQQQQQYRGYGSNPSSAVGGYPQQQPSQAPVPRMGQNNYKNRQAKNNLPPASMTKDSPYGSFM